MSSSHIPVPRFKSSFRTLVSSLFRSRERTRDKIQRLQKRLEVLERHQQRVVNENRALSHRLDQQRRELQESQQVVARLSATSVCLPSDPNLYRHRYGARLISMCCNLAKTVGFRAAESVLKIVRVWLGADFTIPSWTSIRTWLCRSGVAAMTEACSRHDDWILKIDHSVQLGQTNVLIVMGVRQSELPDGRAFRLEDLKTLAVVPGTSRNKESVTAALKELTDQIGTPICVIADGASELYEGVKGLENNGQSGQSVLFLDDIKHKAANILKKTLGKQERFLKFQTHLGATTARIQQTELVHFLPPKKRAKCRFMNLVPLLNWGQMVLYHLQNPSASQNADVAQERMQNKLGWLLEHENDLKSWQVCQSIVSATLEFTNKNGVYRGATDDLRQHLAKLKLPLDELSSQVRDQLAQAYWQCEYRLLESPHASKTMPVSTEALESTLGRFKQLQRQHNRGSFTSLLAALPTLLSPSRPETIARHLKATNNQKLKEWLTNAGLNNSTQAKKNRAYREAKTKQTRHKNNIT